LIAVNLVGGEAFPLLGFGLHVVGVGDFTQAQSEEFGPSESEDFAEGDTRMRNPSVAVEQRHAIWCMLKRVSEKLLV
jgi:phage host-nuclease inhibitor protein Gam